MDSAALPTLSLAQSVLAAQPCSVLLGARLTSFGTRGATLELDVRDDLRQQHGFVHGGVVAYLVDNAITFAAGAALGPDLVTAGFTVDHLRPTRQGRLRAHAVVVRAGTSQATLRCDVHAVDADHHATLCAVGQGRVSLRSTQG